MNSVTMKEMGFTEWYPLRTLSFSNLPYNKGSVFVIIDKTISGKTVSDVMYIGRSKKPTKKILGGYFSGYGGKSSQKINRKLFDEGYMDKTAISWVLSDNPKAMQKELLSKFNEEHGEFPSWNVKKKPQEKPKAKPTTRPTRKAPS
ncbi:MAG TPA: hypothetical protein VMT42_07555 [candidate division Zixibacteria bacterium]|nr:hypothetical protein [candidate division Zixibacteria bacterium]